MSHINSRMLLGGVTLLLFLGLVTPSGAVTLNSGDVLVADSDAFGGMGGVIRVDPVTGAQTPISSGDNFVDPIGIAFAANGDILVVDFQAFIRGLGGVIRVNPVSGAQTHVSSDDFFVNPIGIALEASGNIVISDLSAPGVIRVSPTTGVQSEVAVDEGYFTNLSLPPSGPWGIAVASDGTLFVADRNTNNIVRVNPITGAQTLLPVIGGLFTPGGVAFDAAGQLLVTARVSSDGGWGVFRINPLTGDKEFIADVGAFDLPEPPGLAVEATGGILVTDIVSKSIFRIHPVTHAKTSLSSGVFLVTPRSIAVVPPNRPPAANAGPDQTALAGAGCLAAVTLNGTGSSDPDGDSLTYTWTGLFGTSSGPSPMVSLPGGTNTITLTVSDGHGGTATDTVMVTVTCDATPPELAVQCAPPSLSPLVAGRDSLSGIASVVMTGVEAVQGTKFKRKETYRIQDKAGNRLEAVLNNKGDGDKPEGTETEFNLLSLTYNGGSPMTLPENGLKCRWSLEKPGTLKELEQKLILKDLGNEAEVQAKYKRMKGETEITVKRGGSEPYERTTLPGLVFLNLTTNLGTLGFGF